MAALISSVFSKFPVIYQTEDVEMYVVLVFLVVSFAYPHLGSIQLAPVERWFRALARRPVLSVIGIGIFALVIRAAVLPLLPEPLPKVHDEFEGLLLADTFAHGRVTNPPHPMGVHLETFHVLQEPTYTGIVPPAPALALAAGEAISGHPFVGVWLSMGLLCAAICWMLQGWLPPEWAMLGGLLAVFRFGIFSYWANSYWGGSVPAIGAALVLGAYPRIQRHPRIIYAIVMGVGAATLANSRPYEGFVLCLPVAAGMLIWLFNKRSSGDFQLLLRQVVLPIALLLCATAAFIGYYNWRVTGHALETPYALSMQTANPVPYFPWQALRPIPSYQHRIFREYYLGWDLPQYEEIRTLSGWMLIAQARIQKIFRFYFGAALAFPILLAVLMGGTRAVFLGRLRFLLLCLTFGLAGLLLEVQYGPHYAAPLLGIFLAFSLQATRFLYVLGRRNKSRFLLAARTVPAICVISLLLVGIQRARGYEFTIDWPHSWISASRGNGARDGVLNQLNGEPGQHLVLVRYMGRHSVHEEWVYNLSDIDGSKVVWARDMDAARNQELLDYFHDRHAWLLEVRPGTLGASLTPYAPTSAAAAAGVVESNSYLR